MSSSEIVNWYNFIKNKPETKPKTKAKKTLLKDKPNYNLLIYGQSGIGKSYQVHNNFKDFNIIDLTNDHLDQILTDKQSNKKITIEKLIMLFLDSFFTVNEFADINTKPKIMFINENNIYNFYNYKPLITSIIELNTKYPIIISIDEKHTKLLIKLKKKAMNQYYPPPTELTLKPIIQKYFKDNKIIDKTRGKTSITSYLINNSNNNITKLLSLLNQLKYYINDDNVINNDVYNEFINDLSEVDIKNTLFNSANELLTNYIDVEEALNKFNHEPSLIPLIMEETYMQKINNYNSLKNKPKDIKDISFNIIKSFNYANFYDTYIFNYQKWNLTKIYGFFACALPSYYLSKINIKFEPELKFPSDMNKMSIQKINTKQLFNIYDKFDFVNIEYYIILSQYLTYMMDYAGYNEEDKIINNMKEFIKTYDIDYDTLEKMMKINKLCVVNKYPKNKYNYLFV